MNVTQRMLLGWCLVSMLVTGCAAPDRRSGPSHEPHQSSPKVSTHEIDAPAPGPIEVREEEYENGAVAQREEGYVDADGNFVRHGPVMTWYEDGSKKSEMHFAHGKQHGLRVTWYPTGQMWGRGQFYDGIEDGTWTAWWPNGFKQREWHMDRGTWNGPFNEWHDNGEKRMEFQYVNGIKQGSMRIWDPRGTLVHESEYVDDVEQPK